LQAAVAGADLLSPFITNIGALCVCVCKGRRCGGEIGVLTDNKRSASGGCDSRLFIGF